MVEGRSDAAGAARSATAWSAAGRAPSSAPCIASRRGWTTSTSWSPARCRPTRSGRSPRRRSSASRPTAPTAPTRRWPRPKASARTASRRCRSSRRTTCTRRSPRPSSRPASTSSATSRCRSTVKEAKDLVALTKKTGLIFAVTHNYTAYPMIRQARAMVAAGELGDIRVVQAEYAQDWLTNPIENDGQKQASWRTDPKQSGAGGSIGDIGTHAYNARLLRHRPQARLALRRPDDLREGPQARRQRQHPAALEGRRQGHALGEPGRGRQGERPDAPRLRLEGRARMEAGGPELSLVLGLWRAAAPDHPRRPRLRHGRGSRHARAVRPSRGLSRRLRRALHARSRARSARDATARRSIPTSISRPSRTGWSAWSSSRPRSRRARRARSGSRSDPRPGLPRIHAAA